MENGRYSLTGTYRYNYYVDHGFSQGEIELIDDSFILGWVKDWQLRGQTEHLVMGLYQPQGIVHLSKTPLDKVSLPVFWKVYRTMEHKTQEGFSGEWSVFSELQADLLSITTFTFGLPKRKIILGIREHVPSRERLEEIFLNPDIKRAVQESDKPKGTGHITFFS